MARGITKSTRTKKTSDVELVEMEQEVKETENKERVYKDGDMIPCRSITVGQLFVEGAKTRTLYKWADYGYVEEMDYADLLYDIRSASNSYSNKPCFVIEDPELVSRFPKLEDVYATLYTNGDFEELLSKDADTIQRIVPTLPKRAQESLKSYAATQIRNGQFDSMNKIRVLDEIFGTNMGAILFPG